MKKIISILLLLLFSISAYSQIGSQREHESNPAEMHFDQGASTVDRALVEDENNIIATDSELVSTSISESVATPLFAIKTNLLFDVATLVNIEAEVPIGDRWSIAGEWIFPWWSTCGNKSNDWQSGDEASHRNTLQLLNANLEVKYWLGDRTTKAPMTGWHVGLYAGGGLYDLEYQEEGYQGEFFIAAGISGGYAHTINKSGNLRMEYSAGVGYLQTDYRYYQEHWGIDNTWHTVRQNSGKYSWFGPTRARVSLVWMLNRTK